MPSSSNSMNPWTSSFRASSSRPDIETMCQEPVKGDFDFDIVLLLFVVVFLQPLRLFGDVWNQPHAKCFLLKLPLQNPGIHDESVELDHPGHRVIVHLTAQRPCRVHRAYLEHLGDQH